LRAVLRTGHPTCIHRPVLCKKHSPKGELSGGERVKQVPSNADMFIPFILSKIPHCFFKMNSFENPLQSPRLPRLAGCLQQAKPRFPSLGFLRGDFQLFDGMVSAFKQKSLKESAVAIRTEGTVRIHLSIGKPVRAKPCIQTTQAISTATCSLRGGRRNSSLRLNHHFPRVNRTKKGTPSSKEHLTLSLFENRLPETVTPTNRNTKTITL